MKKFVLASFCTVCLVSFVLADEFQAVVMKVDGSKITYFKTKAPDKAAKGGKGAGKGAGKGGFGGAPTKDGDAITTEATSKATVKQGKFNKDDMKFDITDVEGGLKNDMFKTIDQEKGVVVTLTTADDGADKGKITNIQVGGGGKGGGKGAGKGAGKGGAGAKGGGN